MNATIERVTTQPEPPPLDSSRMRPVSSSGQSRFLYTGLALAGIWVGLSGASIFAPDLVTGSNHEHIPLAAMIAWIWAAVATGLVLLASARSTRASFGQFQLFGIATALTWVIAGLTSVFAPVMVTGTDPTLIPIVALIAPIFAMIVTAFLSVFQAGSPQEGR